MDGFWLELLYVATNHIAFDVYVAIDDTNEQNGQASGIQKRNFIHSIVEYGFEMSSDSVIDHINDFA